MKIAVIRVKVEAPGRYEFGKELLDASREPEGIQLHLEGSLHEISFLVCEVPVKRQGLAHG